MSDGLRDALDALQGDMAAHERRFGGEVHATRNNALAVDAVTRLERERAEAKPVPAPELPAPPAEGRERREGQHGAYIVDRRNTDDTMVRPATPDEHVFLVRAQRRLMLLLSKRDTGPLGSPSWAQRVEAILETRSRVPSARIAGNRELAENLEKRFAFELAELLEDSNRVFGEWNADPPLKVMVG